jgi:RNA-directed DNA polymerase
VAESADADAGRDHRAQGEGNPQGSPISPLLANLFMHYAFDTWLEREFPGCPFERYADDIIAHCDSEEQARQLRAAIAARLETLGLELHPGKTKIAYCKDANHRGDFGHTSFDFLGRDWHLNRRSSADLSALAREINPQVQGWINYYGAFYRSELCFLAWRINEHPARWAMRKFKRFRGKYAKAMAWLQKIYQYKPRLFAHWQLIAFT